MNNCTLIGKKPNHTEIKEMAPLSPKGKEAVNSSIVRMGEILEGKSDKKIWVVGPCSIDFEGSVMEYAEKLAELQRIYSDEIEIVMRFYTGKPRTVGGWKGIQNSAPGDEPDIGNGLIDSRKLAIKIIEELGLPLADEMLHPQLIKSFDDIYSYVAIGARSTENQYHREVSSGLNMPVGFKNPTGGDLEVMANSIKAGQTESLYSIGEDIYRGEGNNLSHGILRGSTTESIRTPNYDKESLIKVYKYLLKANVANPSFLIDTNHDNSGKKPEKQLEIMKSVVHSLSELRDEHPGITDMWKGFMTESYLEEGNQSYPSDGDESKLVKGKSLTDPCSSWENTLEMAKYISSLKKAS